MTQDYTTDESGMTQILGFPVHIALTPGGWQASLPDLEDQSPVGYGKTGREAFNELYALLEEDDFELLRPCGRVP